MEMHDVVDKSHNRDGDPSYKFVSRFFNVVGIAWVIALLFVIGLQHTRNIVDAEYRPEAVSKPTSLASINYFPAQFAGNSERATVTDHVQAF